MTIGDILGFILEIEIKSNQVKLYLNMLIPFRRDWFPTGASALYAPMIKQIIQLH